MKSLQPIFPIVQALGIALALGFATSGCDEVNGPYKDVSPVTPPDTTGTDTTDTDTTIIVPVRKVLLQEFTGHKCGNCPEGAEKAHDLKQIYGDKLILMSVHAGFFASVATSGKYSYDFRTATGNSIDTEYGVTAYPSAIINRTNHQVFGSSAWATVIDTILQKPVQAHIKLTPVITPGTRELKLTVKTTFLQATSQSQNLTVYLVESGKISWQKDYRLPNGQQDIENYSHDHFLRATLTPTWGELISAGPVAADQSFSRQFTYQIPAEYNMAKCQIIAVVNNPVNYSIMQAEESGYLQ
ncbi:MAG: Omp28-related outer membrane protein [Sphingobacteriales bacterium]|nr:MAG: Omp28-related outer membrane protein [Sphingobacteriales bacterium]